MPSRIRLRSFAPKWEGVIRGWAVKFIRNNQWRCDAIHSFDDLLQDAYEIFLKVSATYPRVTEEKHFMSLYKSALSNAITDRARYMKRKNGYGSFVPLEEGRMVADDTYLSALLAEAPDEVRLALMLLEQDTDAVWAKNPEKRENLNMRLRRVAGLCDLPIDFIGALKRFLT